MRNVVIGTVQMQCSKSVWENIEKADFMVRKAAAVSYTHLTLPTICSV